MPTLPPSSAYQQVFELNHNELSYRAIAKILGVSSSTISRWLQGKCSPYGHHSNIGSFQKGHTPWTKGKSLPEDTKSKMRGPRPNFHGNSGSFKPGEHPSPNNEFQKGHIPWIKGKHYSDKAKIKMSQSHRGQPPWNKGNHICLGPTHHTVETRSKMSAIRSKAWREGGKYGANEYREKQSLIHKQLWENPEYAEKMLNKMRLPKPNKQEIGLDTLIQQNFPGEWKYTGDGKDGTRIGRRTPDWININGKKAVIELFGHLWHSTSQRGESATVEYYLQYGYECLIIWSRELKAPSKVINKIRSW